MRRMGPLRERKEEGNGGSCLVVVSILRRAWQDCRDEGDEHETDPRCDAQSTIHVGRTDMLKPAPTAVMASRGGLADSTSDIHGLLPAPSFLGGSTMPRGASHASDPHLGKGGGKGNSALPGVLRET